MRIYCDTSVFGGFFDEEFRKPSVEFFEQVKRARFDLVTSATVENEVIRSPSHVQKFFDEVRARSELVELTDEVLDLRDAYLKARIVGERSSVDALHVAFATVTACRVIVSWNFKHIVHYDRIALYNGVNLELGYRQIGIHSPQEVITYED